MTKRQTILDTFLVQAAWDDALRKTIAGDASNRRYDRLIRNTGETAILMDAPPDKGEDVRPFVRMADYLRRCGLSAPRIYAQDDAHGFLLLEDLGDEIYARVLERSPDLENSLYKAATDVLTHLHAQPPLTLDAYDAPVMAELAAQSFDWYQLGTTGSVNADQRAHFHAEMQAQLAPLDEMPRVVIQRDYHAENLLWLPDRDGVKRVGLLDFQDAMLGHPAYDLVSVLQDARRDVSPRIETEMIARYLNTMPVPHFKEAYARLGIQRNMRILFVFARLSMAFAKPHYVDFIPRVWAHLQRMLAQPGLERLAQTINGALPAPSKDLLQKTERPMRTAPFALMMFAAGFGTRMRPLTLERPKPLVQVAGRALIDHTLDLARTIEPRPIVTNLHYLPDQLESHFEGTDVICLREEPDILDTGGGLKHALPLLGTGPVITTNTDAIWIGPNPFQHIITAWDPADMDALLLCIPKVRVHGHPGQGDFSLDSKNRISRGRDVIYGGIQIIKPEIVAGIDETVFSMNVAWDRLIRSNRLYAAIYPGSWCDIGTPDGLDLAERLLTAQADG